MRPWEKEESLQTESLCLVSQSIHPRDASFSKVDKGWLRQGRNSDGDTPGRWKLIPPVGPCTATLGKMSVHKRLGKCRWKPLLVTGLEPRARAHVQVHRHGPFPHGNTFNLLIKANWLWITFYLPTLTNTSSVDRIKKDVKICGLYMTAGWQNAKDY